MANQKRRIIYLSDDDWTRAAKNAKAADISVSAYFRKLLASPTVLIEEGNRSIVEAVRTAVERNRVTAAMQEFRPVPKPGTKR